MKRKGIAKFKCLFYLIQETCHTRRLRAEGDKPLTVKRMHLNVGGTSIEFIIDSGSSINTISASDWLHLKKNGSKLFQIKRKCAGKFHAYASNQPLVVEATFKAKIEVSNSKPATIAEFFVVKGASHSLLSYQTSTELRILKIGLGVYSLRPEKCEPFPKFPNAMVELKVDQTVQPKQRAYYRVPAAVEELVEKKLQQMLAADIIEKVDGSSDWISPMLVVPKGKTDIRICVDMREPNKAIKREHYPMPIIETFLNKLRGAKFFSRVDVRSAFHHIDLSEKSRPLTTFMTSQGLMRYKRLTFGLNAAPEIFQKTMDSMLRNLESVIAFVDDIVVFGKSKADHDRNLELLLERLKRNNVTLNEEKCLFGLEEIEILGFLVNANGIKPADSKIRAINEFREPASISEVRSFLGLIQFVGQFIPNLASRTEPLRQMIRGEITEFGPEQKKAFNDLKGDLIRNVRQLGYFDPNDETEVYVDASPWAIGGVLVQRKNSKNRIISYISKSLTEAEKRYPQTQREALAAVWAVERLYFYLFGLKFTLFTDHKTLEYIFKGKHQCGKRASTRAEGWALRLQPYDFEIKHIPGISNIADPLSRLCKSLDKPYSEESEHFLCFVEESPPALSRQIIAKATETDQELQMVIKALEDDSWPKQVARFEAFKRELAYVNKVVVREERTVLPESLRETALKIAHRGHPGEVMMKRILRERTWWPGLDRDVQNYLKKCVGCTVTAKEDRPEPIARKELPSRAWQDIAIDFLEVPECKVTFLVVVDYYSRYLMVRAMTKTTADATIGKLEDIFRIWSYPETMTADNGPPFNSEAIAKYCIDKAIKLVSTIPYWPQMNGEVERQNPAVRALKIGKVEKRLWPQVMNEYVYAYNIRPHSVTDKAPLELMTARPVKDLLPLPVGKPRDDDDEVRENDAISKAKGKAYADARRNAAKSIIEIGDTVFVKSQAMGKLESRFSPIPHLVTKRSGNDVEIQNKDGVKYRRCVTHLKKWQGGELEDSSQTGNAVKGNTNRSEEHSDKEEGDSLPKRQKRCIQRPARYL